MTRNSILKSLPCDLEKLRIGALEAFVLSQVHGDATAEDVAETTGLELDTLLKVARHLFELGALSVDGKKHKRKEPTVSPPPSKRRPSLQPASSKATASIVPPMTVPRPRPHVEVRKLGLGPREGFLLSRIDGKTSVADLGEITGLSAKDLGVALRALEQAGAVDVGPRKRRSSTAIPGAAALPKTPPASSPTAQVPRSPSGESDACDLPDAERARINEAAARIDKQDLYEVLGVERDAEGKAIRRAYHTAAGQFHPDRFFGKKLGPFRRPLERIFVRLTLAYDTLSRPARRTEYDATLPPAPARRTQQHVTQPPRRRETEKPPSTKRSASLAPKSTRHPPAPKAPPATAPVPAPKSIERAAPVAPVVSAVLERKVEPPPRPASASRPDTDRRTPLEHAEVFMRAGQDALDRDNLNAAAHHYRLALQCHDDPRLRVALEDIESRARSRRQKGKRA